MTDNLKSFNILRGTYSCRVSPFGFEPIIFLIKLVLFTEVIVFASIFSILVLSLSSQDIYYSALLYESSFIHDGFYKSFGTNFSCFALITLCLSLYVILFIFDFIKLSLKSNLSCIVLVDLLYSSFFVAVVFAFLQFLEFNVSSLCFSDSFISTCFYLITGIH